MEQIQTSPPSFSKLSKEEKLRSIIEQLKSTQHDEAFFKSFWHIDEEMQKVFDEFSENTLTNFYVPYGVVPNILINGHNYYVPMVIEESSVVAACARSSKFWSTRGGLHAETVSTQKIGQVHMLWPYGAKLLSELFERALGTLKCSILGQEANMQARGGGMRELKLVDCQNKLPNYFQLLATFETCDAMGANFINTILETLGREFKYFVEKESGNKLEIIMAILSNYTPDCMARAWVECEINDLEDSSLGFGAMEFARRMKLAADIARVDIHRATTHNKGIYNGIDAVVIATGNDFRAVEACGHTYAARDGQYRGLTEISIDNNRFKMMLEIPMALGTIGGLTRLHPLANISLDLLGRPSAAELMQIAVSIGLAQNFAALRSLVTTGIQKGHMKMHLINILKHLEANESEMLEAKINFADKVVSFAAVREFLSERRQYH